MKKKKNLLSSLIVFMLSLTLIVAATVNLFAASAAASIGDVYVWSTCVKSDSYISSYAQPMIDYYKNMNATVTSDLSATEKHFTGSEVLADSYDLVIVYLPSAALNDNDIAVLQKFIDAGGRICFQAEWPRMAADENVIMSQAAAKLGATFSVSDNIVACSSSAKNYLNADSEILEGVTALPPDAATEIIYSQPAEWTCKADYTIAPDWIVDSSRQGVWLLDQAAGKGRLTIFTDVNFYYSHTGDKNVEQFFKNLLTNAQKNKQLVKDGKDPNATFGDGAKAAVADVVINGKKDAVVNTELTVSIKKDAFKALEAGSDVSAWFDLPKGLTAKVKNAVSDEATEVVVTVSGTVTEEKSGVIAVTIPDTALKGGKAIVADENPNAIYEIHVCGELVKTDAKPATFKADGNTEYYTCKCGKLYSDAKGTKEIKLADTVIPKYVATKVDAKAPTFTAEGNIEYYQGSDGKYYTSADASKEITLPETVIAKLTAEKVEAKPSTFTEEGNKEYYAGSNGKYYSDAECKNEVTLQEVTLPLFSLSKVEATAATTAREGNIEYYKSVDGRYFADAEGTKEITFAETVIEKLAEVKTPAPVVDSPKTGDTENYIVLAILLSACAAFVSVVMVNKKRDTK